jgi:hypothetical protein
VKAILQNFEGHALDFVAVLFMQAIKLNGTKLGMYPLRIMPSKTAIVPVNTDYLPRTQEECELCARTVYVANIDKNLDRDDVRVFFENLCGESPTTGCGQDVSASRTSIALLIVQR